MYDFARKTLLAAATGAALVSAGGALAADWPEGKLAKDLELSLAPGIQTHLSVISDDGQTYSRFKPGSSINLGGEIEIEMKTGKIRSWGIYWGACNDDDCFKFIGHELLYGEAGDNKKHIQKIVNFPLKSDRIPGANGTLNPNPMAASIIAECNQRAQNSGAPNAVHTFVRDVPMTLGVDTFIGLDEFVEAWGGPGPVPTSDIDHAKTVMVRLPIKCEPLLSTFTTSDGFGSTLPDLKLLAAELAMQQGQSLPKHTLTYKGPCPVGVTLHIGATTNIKGAVSGYVQHKSVAGVDWQSTEFTMTTAATNGSHWKQVWTDFKVLPFKESAAPSSSHGGGVVNTQPGGGIQLAPGGGSGGGLNPATSVAAGNSETPHGRFIGYFRYTAYTGKVVLPIGPGGSNVTAYDNFKQTPWRKYDITCESEQSGVAASAPTGVVNPVPPQTGHVNPGQVSPGRFVVPPAVRPPSNPDRVSPPPRRRIKRVTLCRNGRTFKGACLCPRGWTRRTASRFEIICQKPRRRLACIGGRTVKRACLCPRNTTKTKLGRAGWRCMPRIAEPKRRIKCLGGNVRRGRCYCARNRMLRRGVCLAKPQTRKRVIRRVVQPRRPIVRRRAATRTTPAARRQRLRQARPRFTAPRRVRR